MVQRQQAKRPWLGEEALAVASALLFARHAVAARQPEVAGNIRRARDRLADDLLQAPTLAELAAQAMLSRWQLLRCFQGQYGLPPHGRLRLRRAEHARGLIASSSSLAEAAASSGFAGQSHMTRVFVRTYGYTPGALRASGSKRPSDATLAAIAFKTAAARDEETRPP